MGLLCQPPCRNFTPALCHQLPPSPTSLPGERQRQTRAREGRRHRGSDLLEEVFLAVDAPGPGEAPVGQLHLAVRTLEARAVPVSVQDLQDELVQDMLVAASALRDLCGERRERHSEPSTQHCSPDQSLRGCLPSLHDSLPTGGKGYNPKPSGCHRESCGLYAAQRPLVQGAGGN